MNARIWGIIGGVALVLALLSPLVLGNSKKIGQLFGTAEELYERSDYEGAIAKYKAALKESKKFGAKTETIDKDFSNLSQPQKSPNATTNLPRKRAMLDTTKVLLHISERLH